MIHHLVVVFGLFYVIYNYSSDVGVGHILSVCSISFINGRVKIL